MPSRNPWESLLERFPIRGFLLLMMLTSSGVVISSVWRLHTIRTGGAIRIDELSRVRPSDGGIGEQLGYEDADVLKRDLRELIRNENREMLQQLFERINVAPARNGDVEPNLPLAELPALNGSGYGGNGSLINVKRVVPFVKELSREFWNRDWRLVIENDVKVHEYLGEFEATCETYDSLDNIVNRRGQGQVNDKVPLCPCVPATLSKYRLILILVCVCVCVCVCVL